MVSSLCSMLASRLLHRCSSIAGLASILLLASNVAAAAPAAEAPAEPSPAPSGFSDASFGDDEEEFGAAEDDADEEDQDNEDDGAGFVQPPSQLVTTPGARRKLEPPVRVGPSGNARHKWVYSTLLALRYNPLGATLDFSTGHRMQLVDKDSTLFRDSFLQTGARLFTTPAYTRIGPRIDFQPLVLLKISAGYAFVGYYGTFGLMQSFPSVTSDYSETRLDELSDAGENYQVTGKLADVGAKLQAKVGPIAVRTQATFYWADMDLRDGDQVWYDQFSDILFPKRGWVVTNDADAIVFVPDTGLKVAVRYSLAHAFYKSDNFGPGEPITQPNGPHHRIGPGLIYTFFDRPEQRFNKPTAVLLTQWFIQHRYRTGAETSQGLPQITLAFKFEGDLLPHPQRRKIAREERNKARRAKGKAKLKADTKAQGEQP